MKRLILYFEIDDEQTAVELADLIADLVAGLEPEITVSYKPPREKV